MKTIVPLALTAALTACVVACGTAQRPQPAPIASSAAPASAAASDTELPAFTATPAAPTAGATTPTQSATTPTASVPSQAIEGPPGNPEQALRDYNNELYEAGESSRCDEAVARVQHAMARDGRLSDAQLQAEIDHFERVKGSMPYPSPGTACSIFGLQKALHEALAERRRGTAPRP